MLSIRLIVHYMSTHQPYATFEEATILSALLSKVTFLQLLTVLMTLFCIITISSVASAMAKLLPVIKKLICMCQKVLRSFKHLKLLIWKKWTCFKIWTEQNDSSQPKFGMDNYVKSHLIIYSMKVFLTFYCWKTAS